LARRLRRCTSALAILVFELDSEAAGHSVDKAKVADDFRRAQDRLVGETGGAQRLQPSFGVIPWIAREVSGVLGEGVIGVRERRGAPVGLDLVGQ
jgi:hypothetical protein